MKKRLVLLAGLLLIPATAVFAAPAHAGISINLPGFGFSAGPGGVGINIGLPWVVAPAPAPVPVASPTYVTPDNIYEPSAALEPPEFVMAPEMGFYLAVGVPYDLFFYNNAYWINRGNAWYSSAYYNGPWSPVYSRNIPHVFNRFPLERIRSYRNTYYGNYQKNGNWQGYNHFRPARRDDSYNRTGHGAVSTYTRPAVNGQTYDGRARQTSPYSIAPGAGYRSTPSSFDRARPRYESRYSQAGRYDANQNRSYSRTNGSRRAPYGSTYDSTRQNDSDSYRYSRNMHDDVSRNWHGESR